MNNRFFYVFVNIKGALYTADWVKFTQSAIQEHEDPTYRENVNMLLKKHPEWSKYYHSQGYNRSKSIRKICPNNIDSLNRLLDDLKLDYDVNLVITSPKWKDSFDIKTLPALVKNGLNYKNLVIDKTNNRDEDICSGIKSYLTQVGNPDTYIVIDYQDNVCSSFDSNKIIKVDQYSSGLNNTLVDEYLDSVVYADSELEMEESDTFGFELDNFVTE